MYSKLTTKTTVLFLFLLLFIMPFQMHAGDSTSKKTYILIHGSWHSAWNWYKVTPLLEKEGNTVYSIDLPGMGRDKTPIEQVRFATTIQKLCNLIDSIPGKVILVGHSKNGIMLSQLAEYRPHKIEKLIYIAAALVANGKCAKDYFVLDKKGVLGPHITYNDSISSMLQPEIYKEGLYLDCPDDITQMARIILEPESTESANAKLVLTDKNFGSVPRYYIECTEDKAVTPWLQEKMLAEIPCLKVYKLHSSHSPFFSMPDKLVNIILEISKL
jgi:pimeloyl-ACP methyl ester carboxylesterase